MIHETIKKNGLTYGVITGVGAALITTLIYVINLKLFVSGWMSFVSISFYVLIAVLLMTKTKKDLNGIFSFKEAFTTYFISGLIGLLISLVFNILLFNVIDPAAKDAIKELMIRFMVESLAKFNAPHKIVNEAIKDLQENDQFSVIGLIKGTIVNTLVVSIFGLILAAIFKSKASQQE